MGLFHDRKVKKALKQLKSHDGKERIKAIHQLGELRDALAVEPLISLIRSIPQGKGGAGMWAGSIYGKEHEGRRITEHSEAVVALGKIGDKRAIPIIRELGMGGIYREALLQLGDPELLEGIKRAEKARREGEEKRREIGRVMSDRSEISKLLTSLKIISERDSYTASFRASHPEKFVTSTLGNSDLEKMIDYIQHRWKINLPNSYSITEEGKELFMFRFAKGYTENIAVVRFGKDSFDTLEWMDE